MKVLALVTIILSSVLGNKVCKDTDLQYEVETLQNEGRLFKQARLFIDTPSVEAYQVSACKDAIKLMEEISRNARTNLRQQRDDEQDEIRNYLAALVYEKLDCASKNIMK